MDIRLEASQRIKSYFDIIRNHISILSKNAERRLADVPLFAVSHLNIKIGFTPNDKGFVFIASPEKGLVEDSIEVTELKSQADVDALTGQYFNWANWPNLFRDISVPNGITVHSDFRVLCDDLPLVPPLFSSDRVLGCGEVRGLPTLLKNAPRFSVDLWNGANNRIGHVNYVDKVRAVFDRMNSIVNRKSFQERRVHRFINEYRGILLPPHLRGFFEVPLYLNGDLLIADFVLDRGSDLPPMLIELESPVHNVLRNNGDLTYVANHASSQINDWVRFIDSNPSGNASGGYGFLRGPRKERLVIIGRGINKKERLDQINRFGETRFWTYHMLIENARTTRNKEYKEQLNLLGQVGIEPF